MIIREDYPLSALGDPETTPLSKDQEILGLIEPGSIQPRSIRELADLRGRVIFKPVFPLVAGYLGFTSSSSNGVKTTVFFTYGPDSGKIVIFDSENLIKEGWKVARKDLPISTYEAVVEKLPESPRDPRKVARDSIDSAIQNINRSSSLISAGKFDEAKPIIEETSRNLADAYWGIGFALDIGAMLRSNFLAAKHMIDVLTSTNQYLKEAVQQRNPIISDEMKKADAAAEKAADILEIAALEEMSIALEFGEINERIYKSANDLIKALSPYATHRDIAPFFNILSQEVRLQDFITEKMSKEEMETDGVKGLYGLGEPAGGKYKWLNKIFEKIALLWRKPKPSNATMEKLSESINGAMQRTKDNPKFKQVYERIANLGKKLAKYSIAALIVLAKWGVFGAAYQTYFLWYLFGQNAPLQVAAKREERRFNLALELARSAIPMIIARGEGVKELNKMLEDYMKQIDDRTNFLVKSGMAEDIAMISSFLEAQMKDAAALQSQKKDEDGKPKYAPATTTKGDTFLYILGGAVAAYILYLLFSKEKSESVALPAVRPMMPRVHPR
jgi:tetrahydromethanopterin S-methyltransferase subunit B